MSMTQAEASEIGMTIQRQLRAGGVFNSVFTLLGMNKLQITYDTKKLTVSLIGSASGAKIQRGGRFSITYRMGSDDYQIQIFTLRGATVTMIYDSAKGYDDPLESQGHYAEDLRPILMRYFG